jgi:hypothetical protein
MFTRPLTFQTDAADRDSVKTVFPSSILGLCLTRETVEVLADINGKDTVWCVKGANLHRLWVDLVFNRTHDFVAQSWPDQAHGVSITLISPLHGFTVPKHKLFPDRSKVRSDCVQLENMDGRYLFPLRKLEGFAVKSQRGFLLQFAGSHSFILEAPAGRYAALRDDILAGRFSPAALNKFTVFGDGWYRGADASRYCLNSISYSKRDCLDSHDWTVAFDFRTALQKRRKLRPAVDIDL